MYFFSPVNNVGLRSLLVWFCIDWIFYFINEVFKKLKSLIGLATEKWGQLYLFGRAKVNSYPFYSAGPGLTLYLLVPSADSLCKQFGPKSGPTKTKCRAWSGSKLFDLLMVFLKEFCEKVDFEKNRQMTKKRENFPSMQRVNVSLLFQASHMTL